MGDNIILNTGPEDTDTIPNSPSQRDASTQHGKKLRHRKGPPDIPAFNLGPWIRQTLPLRLD